ncbi:MAG: hypothetical protein JSS27_09820 [Planctomycetes bacterium]|nr:hypothetical protein [Planctomycetota bacterium]
MTTRLTPRSWPLGLAALVLLASSVGCQSDFNGQTLPSAWWQTDDVQYFPPGAEFKLAREAAAMQAAKRDALTPNRGLPGVAPGPAPLVAPQGAVPAPAGAPAPLGAPAGAAPGAAPMGEPGAAPAAPANPFGAP